MVQKASLKPSLKYKSRNWTRSWTITQGFFYSFCGTIHYDFYARNTRNCRASRGKWFTLDHLIDVIATFIPARPFVTSVQRLL